jgi:ribosomal protein S18 acetylase RimI-like enzyme
MMKRVFGLIVLFLISLQLVHSSEFTNKEGDLVQIDLCQMNDLKACEEIFITAFSKAYENFTPEQLGVKDKMLFLKEAFADVYDDLSSGSQKLVIAKCKGQIVGFAGFKETEKPGEIYISQLAVDPAQWHQGIGTRLVFSVKEHFNEIKSLVVIPRKINFIAQKFYQKLGFVESSYMHPGYNPERYIGYEWTSQ